MKKNIYPVLTPAYKLYRIPGDVVVQHHHHQLLAGLYVTRAGYFPVAQGHYTERETFDEYLIIYCLAGEGWYETGQQQWRVQKGNVVFILKGAGHAYWADKVIPWTIQWVHFNGTHVTTLLEMAGVTPDRPVLSVGERLDIVNLFNGILKLLQLGYSIYYLISCAAYMRQLLSNIALLNTYSPQKGAKDFNTEKTINLMVENITKQLTLDDFAAEAYLSRSHFSRKFHEKTGYAPVDYFIRLKIQKACELLETTNLSVGEVSHYLGYKDRYYFSRIFRKIMGVSPKQYRSSQKM